MLICDVWLAELLPLKDHHVLSYKLTTVNGNGSGKE